MKFDEFLRDDKMFAQALKCKNIEEFKKLAEKNDVVYLSDEQLNKGWSWVRAHAPSEDGSLDDDALDAVAGGKKGYLPPPPCSNLKQMGLPTIDPTKIKVSCN